MLARANSICFLGAWIDACCLWRMYFPHVNFPGSSFYCFALSPNYNRIAANDIIVVQRCCSQAQFDFIKNCATLGHRVIYDLDDDVWDIPKGNPAGPVLSQYKDGFISCVRMCDVVSVSTRELAKAVRRNVKQMLNLRTKREIPIIVAENRIDEKLFARPLPKEPGSMIVGWQGSTSHIPDLLLVQDALKQVATEYPDVIFEFRGLDPPDGLRQMSNVRHKLWMPVAEFTARMPTWGWDIALAPVIDHSFNGAKSCIKMQEAAYCGIPCLASWVAPYDYFVSHDPELRWLLCAGQNNWAPKIRTLLNEPERREFLGKRMYDVAMTYFSWNKPHEGWTEVFQVARDLG